MKKSVMILLMSLFCIFSAYSKLPDGRAEKAGDLYNVKNTVTRFWSVYDSNGQMIIPSSRVGKKVGDLYNVKNTVTGFWSVYDSNGEMIIPSSRVEKKVGDWYNVKNTITGFWSVYDVNGQIIMSGQAKAFK